MMNEKLLYSDSSENISENYFEKTGGKILEWDDNGQPMKWICGIDSQTKFIHPFGIDDKDVAIHLATLDEISDPNKCQYVGRIKSVEVKKDRACWP